MLHADVAMAPTLAVLGAVGDALDHDFELLFLPTVLLVPTREPTVVDESWPGVVAVRAHNVATKRGTGPLEPLLPAISEAAREVGAAFSAAAEKEFKGDLANYPVWRFLLPTDDAGGNLQLRFIARQSADNAEDLGVVDFTIAPRWPGGHRALGAFID